MRRLLRWRLALPALLLFALFAIFAGWLYTRSASAARLVSQRLEERLGTAARFDGLFVGLSGSSLSNLKVYEHGTGPESDPFVSVGEVDLDLSAVGAALGQSPNTVWFRDAHVVLRFDRNGDLITKLPQAVVGDGGLPTIRIESGTLTLRQEGRADSVFHGIDLTVSQVGDSITLTGTVEDQAWGKWTADGSIPPGGTGRLTLKTAAPHRVTPELLKRVPFVSPTAWTSVGLEGTTAAQLDLLIDRATGHVTYRLSMEPTGTTVNVPSIGLRFTDATGGLTAEGAVVTLADVHGKSAGGEVHLDSRMDFSGPDSVLRFMADLSNMDVKGLPKTWRLPPELDGRLTGKLEFNVTLPAGGGTKVEAAGKATIADARLKGRPVPPIELNVSTSAGGGLQFAEPADTANGRHEALKPMVPDPPPVKADPKGRRPGLVSSFLKLAARLVKPPGAGKEDRAYLHLNVTFRDVDVAELLKSAGVEVPVKVAGKVTVQVQLDIPTETPDDFKAYRMTGSVTARRVTVDELAVERLTAKLDLRNGKLVVKDFVGRLPSLGDAGTGGSFQARGEMDVGGAYPFKASVKFDKVALEHVEQLRHVLPLNLQLAGVASVHGNLEGTLSPVAVKTNGEAQVQKLKAGTIPADNLTFRWESDDQVIRFRDASARLFGGEVSGEFDVPVRDDVAGTGALKLANLDLGEMLKGLMPGANLKLEGKAAGTVKLRSPAAGEGEARGATAEVDLQAPALKLQGLPARKIKGTAQYAAGSLKYTLTGEALGGQFEVAGQYPPAPKKGAARSEEKKGPPKKDEGLDLGRIKLRSMQLSRLWELVGLKNALGPLDADVSGDFPLTTDDAGRLVGTGRLRAERLRWSGREIATAGQTVVRLTSTEMVFDEMTFFVGEGVARARAAFNRADINRSTASVVLSNVPARRLVFLFPDLANRLDLPVDGRLTTTMGRDWRGSGVLTSARGRVYGIPVTDVRLPIDWTVIPDAGRTQVRVRDFTATAGGGPLSGRADLNLSSDLPPRFSGDLQFRNVNLGQAFRDAGRWIGELPMTGKLEFASSQYRGPNDLTARLDARLGQSQPFALPLFSSVVPYLGFGSDSSQTVREGEVRASLGGGVWRVERLTLSGSSMDFWADGTVTTAGGLNLAVTARSRSAPGQAVLRRFTPFAALTAAPARTLTGAALVEAIGLIGNYVVHLEVTGTIDSPVIRLETLRTLTEDAIRFFLISWALRQ